MSMTIDVQNIPIEGVVLACQKQAESFPVLKSLADDGECRFIDPLAIDLTVVPERNLIRVDGVVTTRIEQACSRCLAEYASGLEGRFTLRFSPETPEAHPKVDPPEIELSAEHIGLTLFAGETIDFTDSIQEQVVLALPYKPLCSENCKGLCPRCGTDLNARTCGCPRERAQNPFAALKRISWPTQQEK